MRSAARMMMGTVTQRRQLGIGHGASLLLQSRARGSQRALGADGRLGDRARAYRATVVRLTDWIPLGRFGNGEDIATRSPSSPPTKAPYITGQVLVVDGRIVR